MSLAGWINNDYVEVRQGKVTGNSTIPRITLLIASEVLKVKFNLT